MTSPKALSSEAQEFFCTDSESGPKPQWGENLESSMALKPCVRAENDKLLGTFRAMHVLYTTMHISV